MLSEECYARIGLMGNPSDGFGGKTLSFLIRNFSAIVTLCPHSADSLEKNAICFSPHKTLDPFVFEDIHAFHHYSNVNGYYGGLRLLQATVQSFMKRICAAQKQSALSSKVGFTLAYDTTIPRCVGLSGSSAIIVATFNILLKYYDLTIADLNISQSQYPDVILNIEKEELHIAAGLQDRVIQTYGGCVHMDFTNNLNGNGNIYTPVAVRLLPNMYLVYNIHVGGDSGKVHSTVKERWLNRDPGLITGMATLGQYADEAKNALENGDAGALAVLMQKNFAMRRELYGDDVVGEKNIAVIMELERFGLAGKFTGSGGAIVCQRLNNEMNWFQEDKEKEISEVILDKYGFAFCRVHIPESA